MLPLPLWLAMLLLYLKENSALLALGWSLCLKKKTCFQGPLMDGEVLVEMFGAEQKRQ